MHRIMMFLIGVGLLAFPASFSAAQAVENGDAPHTAHKARRVDAPAPSPAPGNRDAIVLEQCLQQAGGEKKVDELKEKNDADKSKIADLCGKGKREIAQGYARDTATELMRDPRVVELQKCPKEVIKTDPSLSELVSPTGVQTNHHICD